MLDLEPIKARRDKATPGPWNRNKWLNFSAATTGDCEFIANAPTDIAALIEEVERVRAEIATMKSALLKSDSGSATGARKFL